MRKVQDHYFHRAKKENYPARSVYKLEELQKRYAVIRPGHRVLDLGCAPGSWSLYASRLAGPQGLVVGVDLKDCDIRPPSSGSPIHFLQADMTCPEIFIGLGAIAQIFDVVVSDAAPNTSGSSFTDHQRSLALARRTLEIASKLLRQGGAWYCKVFQGGDFESFVREARPLFISVRTVKPKSSRAESREMFVFGQGFRGRLPGDAGEAASTACTTEII